MPILGSALATEQPRRLSWSPDRGPCFVRSWEGPISAINNLAVQAYSFQLQYDITEKLGGMGRIEVTYASFSAGGATGAGAGGPEIVDNWELLPNTVQKDIFHADVPIIRGLDQTQIADIKATVATVNSGGDFSPPWTPGANEDIVYNLIQQGVEHWEIDQPILRRTWVVPQGQSLTALYSNIRKMLTTSQLLAKEGVPPDFVLPINTITKSFPDPTFAAAGVMNYGWVKSMPTANLQNFVRREVHMEWKFGLWNPYLVEAAT